MFWGNFNLEFEVAGFILADGLIVQTEGESSEGHVTIDDTDILKYVDQAVATWHTHVSGTANLSVHDWDTFVSNCDLKHFIIAVDEVRGYEVVNGSVLNIGALRKSKCTPSTFMDLFGLIVELPKATKSKRQPRGKLSKVSVGS